MTRMMVEAAENVSKVMRNLASALGGIKMRPIYDVWAEKMSVEVFEARGATRRKHRKEGKRMPFVRLIASVLTLFFYLFVILGAIVVVGILVWHPLLGMIAGACVIAGFLAAWYEYRQGMKERRDV